MLSIRKIKVVALLSVVVTLAAIGSGWGQTPAIELSPVGVSAPLAPPSILLPPTAEQQREQKRAQYVSLHTKLAVHLTDAQLQERIEALQKEVTAAQERSAREAREKRAKDELAKATALLAEVANKYKGTEAGTKVQQALDQANGTPPK